MVRFPDSEVNPAPVSNEGPTCSRCLAAAALAAVLVARDRHPGLRSMASEADRLDGMALACECTGKPDLAAGYSNAAQLLRRAMAVPSKDVSPRSAAGVPFDA